MGVFHVISQCPRFVETSAALQTNEVLLCVIGPLTTQLDLLDRSEPVELPEHHDVVVHFGFLAPVDCVDVNFVINLFHDIFETTEVTDALLRLDLGQITKVRLRHVSKIVFAFEMHSEVIPGMEPPVASLRGAFERIDRVVLEPFLIHDHVSERLVLGHLLLLALVAVLTLSLVIAAHLLRLCIANMYVGVLDFLSPLSSRSGSSILILAVDF